MLGSDYSDYYDVLCCSPHSTPDQIQAEYRCLARRFHPDRGPPGDEWTRILQAYQVLIDPHQRAQYDRWRAARPPMSFGQWQKHSMPTHWSLDTQRQLTEPQDIYDLFRNYQV